RFWNYHSPSIAQVPTCYDTPIYKYVLTSAPRRQFSCMQQVMAFYAQYQCFPSFGNHAFLPFLFTFLDVREFSYVVDFNVTSLSAAIFTLLGRHPLNDFRPFAEYMRVRHMVDFFPHFGSRVHLL